MAAEHFTESINSDGSRRTPGGGAVFDFCTMPPVAVARRATVPPQR